LRILKLHLHFRFFLKGTSLIKNHNYNKPKYKLPNIKYKFGITLFRKRTTQL